MGVACEGGDQGLQGIDKRAVVQSEVVGNIGLICWTW